MCMPVEESILVEMVFEWQGGWVITLIDWLDGRGHGVQCLHVFIMAAIPALQHIIMHAQRKTGVRAMKKKNPIVGYKWFSSSTTTCLKVIVMTTPAQIIWTFLQIQSSAHTESHYRKLLMENGYLGRHLLKIIKRENCFYNLEETFPQAINSPLLSYAKISFGVVFYMPTIFSFSAFGSTFFCGKF